MKPLNGAEFLTTSSSACVSSKLTQDASEATFTLVFYTWSLTHDYRLIEQQFTPLAFKIPLELLETISEGVSTSLLISHTNKSR